MNRNYYIAKRFLFHKKRAMLMSLSGIIFGVGFFIVTQAQTSGFEHFFIRTILGTDGALRVQEAFQDTRAQMEVKDKDGNVTTQASITRKYREHVENPYAIKKALLDMPEVSGVSEVLRGGVELTSKLGEQFINVYGVNIEEHLNVSHLEDQIIRGEIEDFQAADLGVLLGSKIAERGNIEVGDSITLSSGKNFINLRVSAIFETGVEHVDRKRVYVHIDQARTVLGKPFEISYIQVNMFEPERAEAFSAQLQDILQHVVTPWQKREQSWLEVFKALRVSSALTVSTIIVIAGLGMFNTLAMIVMEKQKEIAILRSMGYTRLDITQIFLWKGFLVYSVGSIVGCAFAVAATYGITKIPLRIRGIFSTDHFVVHWSIDHYIFALISAAIIVSIAAYIPARRAAKLEPGDIIRGTGG